MLNILVSNAQLIPQSIGAPNTSVTVKGNLKADSVLDVPKRIPSPGRQRDTGSIYYKIADSSHYGWTGNAWRKIGGTGGSIAKSSQTADGNYTQNWNQHPLRIDSIGDTVRLSMFEPQILNPSNNFRFNLSGHNSLVTPFALEWGMTDVSGSGGDSAYGGVYSSSLGTSLNHFHSYGSKFSTIDLNGGFNTPHINIEANDLGFRSKIYMDRSVYIQANDSTHIQALPAATADSVLGIRSTRNVFGYPVSTLVKFPVPSGGGSATSGYGWINSAGQGKIDTPVVDLRYVNVHNIVAYGAVGDGLTDCTDAINAAINAAQNTKGAVLIPAGTFLVRSSYRDTAIAYRPKGIILKSNVTIVGAGRDRSIIKLSAPPTDATFTIVDPNTKSYTSNCAFWNMVTGTGVSNVILKDFSIDGNKSNQINIGSNPYHTPQNGWADSSQTNGIYFSGGSNNRIENVKLDSITGYGIWYNNSKNGLIDKVKVTTSYNGGVYYFDDCSGSIVKNSLITNNYCDNIRVKSSNVSVVNNEVSWTKFNSEVTLANFAGIYVEGNPADITGVKITGNYCHDNSSFGVDVWVGGDTSNSSYPGASVIIAENTIAYNSNGGIECAMPNVTISNNTIYNNGANSSNVQDNDFYRPYGINLTIGTTKGINITGNIFRDTRGYQTYAIGNGPDVTVAEQLTFSNNTVSGGLGMFEPGSVSTSVPGSMLVGNTYRTGITEQETTSYMNGPLTVVTGTGNAGITVKGNAAPAFWLNNNTSNKAALGLATSAEVWQKQTLADDVVLWNEGRGILFGTAATSDSSEIEIRRRKVSVRDTLQLQPSGSGTPTGNPMLFWNLSGLANSARSAWYPGSGTNSGLNINFIPRGSGFSSTDKVNLQFFNTDALSDGTNYEVLQFKSSGSGGYIWNSLKSGTGTTRDIRFQFDGADHLYLKADGNIGVGLSNPNNKLHIQFSSTSGDGLTIENTSSAVGARAQVFLKNDAGLQGQFGTMSSTHATLPNYILFEALKGLQFGVDQGIASGGTSPINFVTGGYSIPPRLIIGANGTLTASSLAGSGTRMVTADASGNLATQSIPSGGNGIYGGNGSLPSDVTVTGSNHSLTLNDIFRFQVNSDYNVIAMADGSGPYSEGVIGSGKQYWLGYTPTEGVYSKGAGIVIDTNENVGIGVPTPTTAPLYATGASLFVQGLQSNTSNFYKVSNLTADFTASLSAYFYTIDASGGNVTATLPAASTAFGNTMGITYKFQRIDNSGNTVTIQRAGSDTINGATSFTLTSQYQVKQIQCTSTSTWAQW